VRQKLTDLATEVTLQPVRRIDVDAAILFSDLLLPLEPMGIAFDFIRGEGPSIENSITQPEDIDALSTSRTGDLGYVDEDGFFYYSGRKKDSLRRRGENVSAWEVERIVNAHPAVEESAVVGVTSEIGEQEIRVFVQLAPQHQLDPLELIKWCERDLAYYQIPRYVDFVAEFPRGPTQRIQKSGLAIALAASWDLEKSGYKVRR